MAYDEELAERIRDLLEGEPDVTEQRMFGGLGFLAGGHMAVASSSKGGLMVRCAPEDTEALMAEPHAEPFEMRGRPVQGWLRLTTDGVRGREELESWVWPAVAYARALEG